MAVDKPNLQLNREEGKLKSKPASSTWAGIVQSNRASEEGWKLEWVKPTGAQNTVKITKEEWDMGTSYWDTMLVGYIPGI